MIPARRRADNPVPVPGWELFCLACLIAIYLSTRAIFGDDGAPVVNTLGPIALATILALSATLSLLANPVSLWTGLFSARVATAVYFGLGSVTHNVMNSETLGQLSDFYAVSAAQISKVNLIVACCVFCILMTVRVGQAIWPARRLVVSRWPNDKRLLAAALLFGLVGYAVKYMIVFPASVGAYRDVVIPGMIVNLVWLAPVSIFLITTWSLRRSRAWLVVVTILVFLDVAAGAARFSKSDALMPMLMFMLANLHYRVTLQKLVLTVLLTVFAFKYLEPAVAYGRGVLLLRYDALNQAGLTERFGILEDYFQGAAGQDRGELQGSLLRITYLNAAAPAVALYDAGRPGRSLEFLPWIFVPRILWPDKPIFDLGIQYSILVVGSEDSSTGMGYFAEAYWNLGWLGIPVVMIPLGLILLFTGRYASWVIREEQWVHFPAVFMAMRLGLRIDGEIAADIGFATLVVLLAYPLARLATSLLDGMIGPDRRPAPRRMTVRLDGREALASRRYAQ